MKIYEKAHLMSDFRKKYLLSWGSNPRNETKPEEIYGHERVGFTEIVKLSLLDFRESHWTYHFFFLDILVKYVLFRSRIVTTMYFQVVAVDNCQNRTLPAVHSMYTMYTSCKHMTTSFEWWELLAHKVCDFVTKQTCKCLLNICIESILPDSIFVSTMNDLNTLQLS